jgi:hypothetical protein
VWHVVLWESTIAGPKLRNIDNDDEEDTDDKITTTYVECSDSQRYASFIEFFLPVVRSTIQSLAKSAVMSIPTEGELVHSMGDLEHFIH